MRIASTEAFSASTSSVPIASVLGGTVRAGRIHAFRVPCLDEADFGEV